MSNVHAVLLVPEDGDPLGLLREGPCGARPPIAHRYQCFDGVHFAWDHKAPNTPCGCPESLDEWQQPMSGTNRIVFVAGDDDSTDDAALVLAWNGEPVSEGLDRANHRIAATGVVCCWPLSDDIALLVDEAQELEAIGTILLLDAQGNEVTTDAD